jgi:hypothetical protein
MVPASGSSRSASVSAVVYARLSVLRSLIQKP